MREFKRDVLIKRKWKAGSKLTCARFSLPISLDPVQFHHLPELHGQFRAARRSTRVGTLQCRDRRQMLRIGRPISVQRFRPEMRIPGPRGATVSQPLLS